MGIPVLILGESGSGKSTSMRNFDTSELIVFNVANKLMPFRKKLNVINNANYDIIGKELQKNEKKVYVIDDSQYLLAFELFNRAKEKGYEFEVLSYYYALLNHLLVTYQDHEEGLTMYDTDRLTRLAEVADYITENYTLELNQKEVAEMFGFSSSYLSKLFKKKANINYKAFVEEVRVVNAHREMMNTDHSLCDIAFNNGFPNNKSFIKAFVNS